MGDLRFAFRVLGKNPGYAAVAIITLGLAVGGATAIFSVLNAVVLRPLPYAEPERLVVIRDSAPPRLPSFSVSPARFLAWQTRTHVFESITAQRTASLNLTGSGDPQRLQGVRVAANYFGVLGVAPLRGRTFLPEDDAPTAPRVIVLSEALWRGAFASAEDAVGRTIQIDDLPTTIIGVMPARLASTTQAWMPLALTDEERTLYGSHYLSLYGRLNRGATVEAARADIVAVAKDIEPISPSNKGWTALVDPLLEYSVRNVKAGLWVLSGGVGVLLLIACANIANLLLARGLGRQRELGVRAALGATRARLMRQMLAEYLVMGLAGSALGVGLAFGILQLVVASPTMNLPRAQTIALDLPTLVFALALAGVAPFLFGLIPALQISRTDLRTLVTQGGRSGGSALRARTRSILVVAECALAVLLVSGSLLLLRSFGRLMDVSPGFETDRQLVISISLPGSRYQTPDQIGAFWNTLVERAGRLPGVDSAAVTQSVPLLNDYVSSLDVPGSSDDPSTRSSANFYAVTPAYFRTMGITILKGRGLTQADGAQPRVSVVSKSLADRFFAGEDPIGKQIRISQGPGMDFGEIVGVVNDIKQYGLDATTTMQLYEPVRRHAYFNGMSLIVRTAAAPEALTASVRALLKELDPNLPIAPARTLASVIANSVGPRRLTTTLLAAFAGVALLLAAIGVYGLVSFAVGQRTQEIGIRVALGARRGGVLRLVFAQGLGLTVAGVVAGGIAGVWAAKLLQTELFETSPRDPVALGLARALLLAVAALACLWPARRALKIDPVTALRQG